MVNALAPRRPPASRWSWLSIVLALGVSPSASAQGSKPGGDPPKGAPAKEKDDDSDATKEDREKTGVVDKGGPKVEPVEMFSDPRAKAALGDFPELFKEISPLGTDDRAIDAMSKGGQVDQAVIVRYLKAQANRLTKKAFLQAMIDADAKSLDARQIEIATTNLLKPLLVPASGANAGFRRSYVDQILGTIAQPLLKNHLFAREAIMIVLSESADQSTLPIFLQVLEDSNQLLQVKDRAAYGITKAAKGGQIAGRQIGDAAAALTGFLEAEPEAFYFVKLRVLEALAALHVASSAPARGRPEVSEAVLKLLADPKQKLDVRAYAGSALGQIQPGSIARYNYPLVAHEIAQAALDTGRRLSEIRETQPLMANRLSVFLMMLTQAITGDPAVPGYSGIIGASPEAASPYSAKLKAVFAAAIDYSRAIRAQLPIKKKALDAALNDLKAAIDKKPPTDRALVPGGAPLAIVGTPPAGQK